MGFTPSSTAFQRETSRPGVRAMLTRGLSESDQVICVSFSFSSNLKQVKAGPVAKQPFIRRCRTPWAARPRTPACRPRPRGTTPWTTTRTTTPPSPAPWSRPRGESPGRAGLPPPGVGMLRPPGENRGTVPVLFAASFIQSKVRAACPHGGDSRGDPVLPSMVLAPAVYTLHIEAELSYC